MGNALRRWTSFLLTVPSVIAWSEPARSAEGEPLCFVATSLPAMHSSPDRGGYLFLGHELAMKEDSSLRIRKYESKGTDESLVSTVEKMAKDGCKVILGLFTSKEALLAGRILSGKDIIGLSASASHVGLRQIYPAIVSAVPAADAYTSKVVSEVEKMKGRIVVVVQPDDLYSTAMAANVFKQWSGPKPLKVELRAGTPLALPPNVKPNEPVTFVFTTYPIPSIEALSRLNALGVLNKKATVVGSASWVFDLAAFRNSRDLLTKVGNVLVPETLDRASSKYKDFESRFTKEFKMKPENLAGYSYDTTAWASRCWKKTTKTAKEFLACLQTQPFDGVTGRIQLSEGDPFPRKDVFLAGLLERL